MFLALDQPWQEQPFYRSLTEPTAAALAGWDIAISAAADLAPPPRPLYEAQPVFQGPICRLIMPGFAGMIDFQRQYAHLQAHPAATMDDIRYFLRVVLALALFRHGSLLAHAAAVVSDGSALLFTGHSGSGKSTIAALAGSRVVLHDDLVCLHPHGEHWLVQALPEEDGAPITSYPLAGVVLLAHAPDNYLSAVRPAVVLGEAIANSPVINASPDLLPQLVRFWQSLLAAIPVRRLHFRPDDSFWSILDAHFA